jgi:hypothetical protein
VLVASSTFFIIIIIYEQIVLASMRKKKIILGLLKDEKKVSTRLQNVAIAIELSEESETYI